VNKRLRHTLKIFYRLAEIEMLNETQIYIALKVKEILKDKRDTISIISLKRNTPDVSQDTLIKELQMLSKLKYLVIKNGKVIVRHKFLKKLMHD